MRIKRVFASAKVVKFSCTKVAYFKLSLWRKHKPNLYKIVMLGFKFDELIQKSRQNYEELSEFEAAIKADIEKFKEKSD